MQGCLLALNRVLIDSGEFEAIDIKSRAVPLQDALVGIEPGKHAFAHVTLALLSGRSEQTRQDLSARLLGCLQVMALDTEAQSLQLSVNVVEMIGSSYSKMFAKSGRQAPALGDGGQR
jgi:5-carboxymethyl-2-hydroxymuconate isomerase